MILNKHSNLKEKRIKLPDGYTIWIFQRIAVLLVDVSMFLKNITVRYTERSTEIVHIQSKNNQNLHNVGALCENLTSTGHKRTSVLFFCLSACCPVIFGKDFSF